MTTQIAVGVDGTEASLIALRWAVAEAQLRDATLKVVIVHPPVLDWPNDTEQHVADLNKHIADRVDAIRRAVDENIGTALAAPDGTALAAPDGTALAAPDGTASGNTAPTPGGTAGSGAARATGGPPPVSTDVVQGHPAQVLAEVSTSASMLVVGGRGQGAWQGALAGSLTGQLAGRTRAPMVSVRSLPERRRGRIVVGVDGRSSHDAVRFAFEEAALRGSSVLVVTTWQLPVFGGHPSADAAAMLEAGATAAQREGVGDAPAAHPGVPIETTVRMDHPVDALADAAADADLVVVGSRGRGGFTSLMLGSVAIGVLHRVTAPVAVVPERG